MLSGTASQQPTLTRALHWTPVPPNTEAVWLPPLTPNNGKMEAVPPLGRWLGPSPPSAEPQPWLLSLDLGGYWEAHLPSALFVTSPCLWRTA